MKGSTEVNEDRSTADELTDEDQLTILIVEDYSDTRALLCTLLRRRGFKVVEAENGKEAIREASRYNPDLILMDLAMPEMDGSEAVRRIRAVPKLADTPIFVVSAYVTDAVRDDVVSAGGVEVIVKPFETDDLITKIESVLNKPQP